MHLEVQETRCTYRSARFSALASQHYKDSLGAIWRQKTTRRETKGTVNGTKYL